MHTFHYNLARFFKEMNFCELGMDFEFVTRKNSTLTAEDVDRVDKFGTLLAFFPLICIVAALILLATYGLYQ